LFFFHEGTSSDEERSLVVWMVFQCKGADVNQIVDVDLISIDVGLLILRLMGLEVFF
jgi:hypothetical protein